MKKKVIGLALLATTLVLEMAMAGPALAAEDSLKAEVEVGAVVNFTVQDNGDPGLKFGFLVPGSRDNPELAQDGGGGISLLLGPETNVESHLATKADDFTSGSEVIPIENAVWHTEGDVAGATPMSTEYTLIATLSSGESQDLWHWLNVPADQNPGSYTTYFYYEAQPAMP